MSTRTVAAGGGVTAGGNLFGVGIRLRASWWWGGAILAGLIAAGFLREGAPVASAIGLAVLLVLLFQGSVLGHELAHGLTALRLGLRVEGIRLSAIGGSTDVRRGASSSADLALVALSGPIFSAAVGLLLLISLGAETLSGIELLDPSLLAELGGANLALALFSLMPLGPLDGARIVAAVREGRAD